LPIALAAIRPSARAFSSLAASQGDAVVADNLGSHKVASVCEAIEARGARLLLLPAYSPDLNPIEQVFVSNCSPGWRKGVASRLGI
jgi:transposase